MESGKLGNGIMARLHPIPPLFHYPIPMFSEGLRDR